jgi:hypothetical protein
MADLPREFEPLPVSQLTWTVLLGRWVEFARAAVALPSDGEGGRWRGAVPDVIQLQAVCFSLEHLHELAADERALGLDRAAVLIERHAAALSRRWDGGPLPSGLRELIDDARAALRRRQDDADPGAPGNFDAPASPEAP